MQNAGSVSFSPVGQAEFRKAIGSFMTGVAVVTTSGHNGHQGMTINSLTSVSLDPCLLLICLRRGSATGIAIREAGGFVVNLLNDEQHDIAKRFSTPTSGRFDGVELGFTEDALPVLPGCLAHLCCAVEDIIESGDHDIIIGQAQSYASTCGNPLIFFNGAFGSYQHSAVASWGSVETGLHPPKSSRRNAIRNSHSSAKKN